MFMFTLIVFAGAAACPYGAQGRRRLWTTPSLQRQIPADDFHRALLPKPPAVSPVLTKERHGPTHHVCTSHTVHLRSVHC